jgi:hypothetical protein
MYFKFREQSFLFLPPTWLKLVGSHSAPRYAVRPPTRGERGLHHPQSSLLVEPNHS